MNAVWEAEVGEPMLKTVYISVFRRNLSVINFLQRESTCRSGYDFVCSFLGVEDVYVFIEVVCPPRRVCRQCCEPFCKATASYIYADTSTVLLEDNRFNFFTDLIGIFGHSGESGEIMPIKC